MAARVQLRRAGGEHGAVDQPHGDGLRILQHLHQAGRDLGLQELVQRGPGRVRARDSRGGRRGWRRRRRGGPRDLDGTVRRQRRELPEGDVRRAGQREVEGQIDHAGGGQRAKPDQPQRHTPGQLPAAGVDAAPLRRQLPLELAAALADAAIEAVAQLGERRAAAPQDAIPPLEAERGAQIHQLDHLGMATGILLHLLQNAEEALAAGDLVVEAAGEAPRHPRAGTAPRRAEHQVVDRGTERVARGAQAVRVEPGRHGARLEFTHRLDHAAAELVRIGRPAAADAGGRHQQRRRRGDQRVGTDRRHELRLLDAPGPDWRGAGPVAAAAAAGAGRGAVATPPGRGSISVALTSPGSAKGSSVSVMARSSPDRPALYFQAGDVPCDMNRYPP